MEEYTRLLIADDAVRSRAGLRALLSTCRLRGSTIEVVAEATDGHEAVQLVKEHQPDVVLMDARMPGMDGLEATRRIKAIWPEVKVIVLTMYPAYRARALAVGADAFVVKGCPPEDLFETILGT